MTYLEDLQMYQSEKGLIAAALMTGGLLGNKAGRDITTAYGLRKNDK